MTLTRAIGDAIAPLVAEVPEKEQPLMVALIERIAAARYRSWAADASEPDGERLLACAAREEEIARRVEALYADASAVQSALRAKHPDLERVYRELFRGHELDEQYAMQAAGERLGASTWRTFAGATDRDDARQVFHACAELEEASAEVLEALAKSARRG